MRGILNQPLTAVLTAGEPPVVFEEQVCADYLDEVQESLRTHPPSLFRIERVPEAEGIVARVPVLRGSTRIGVDAWKILGHLIEDRVERVLVETDADVDRVRLADDVESGELVRQ
ncbi:hypothetical protein [Streptomyces sp. NPDC126522]|uniref:hypothetical protein n=1 Tax=Streptomyces sp. NPDC126522 TaxID=3155211 RepID=UPI00331AF07E